MLYVTPEKLDSNSIWECFRKVHAHQNLARFVIDEAHCVSQWGHDFRPAYKQLGRIRREFPDVPIMALTATATPKVQEDVKKILRMGINPARRGQRWSQFKLKVFKNSFNRSNLRYSVVEKPKKKEDAYEKLRCYIARHYAKQTGIVYCLSRDECADVAAYLSFHGMSADAYHAGMNQSERCTKQCRWQAGVCHVICATIAYGMGIDKADVRFVLHFTLPKSIEGYYQESGRAGRDGVCLWSVRSCLFM